MKVKSQKKQVNKYVKFSGMAFQMLVIIIVGVVLGQWLDKKYPNENQLFTIIFSLLFVILALYYVVSKIISNQKKD